MVKKNSDRKQKSMGNAGGLSNIFNERTDFFLGLILWAIAVYCIVAMCSFLKTGEADQSLLEHLRPGEWMNTDHEFQNYCASTGAIVSYVLIAQNFGFPAFLIPVFIVVVGLKLMRACRVDLWKWFFGLGVAMVWSSVVLAKFLAPFTPHLIFNPGGNHGLFVVQQMENIVGTPGLTAVLFIVAVIFLSFVTNETITVVRKAMNPVGYITNKVKFTINDHHGSNDISETIYSADNIYGQNAAEEEDKETEVPDDDNDKKEGTNAAEDKKTGEDEYRVTDLDIADKDATDDTNAGEADKTADDNPFIVEAAPSEADIKKDDDSNLSFLEQQRKARIEAAEDKATERAGMEIEVAKEEEKATGTVVTPHYDMNTPINPLEPFLTYRYPTLDLLKKYDDDSKPLINEEEQIANKNRIIEVLDNFGVKIKTIRATVGPTITLYEIQPAEGVRISKIKNLEDDIALSLAALGIRIIAPIPGKGTIGIEVPNASPRIVSMESILNSKKFQETRMALPIALGKTITNEVFMADLAKIPHLLVAGATGQGKSVCLNAIITSLLYKKHPNEMKIVLIDPKKVEFSIYAKIAPHFMAVVDEEEEPIITDVTKVVRTLNALCKLMDTRYDLLKMAGARNIVEYNQKFVNHRLDLTKGHEYMPYIVVVIDEFGDLIMTAGKEVELPIARIAQLARAIGIHMIIATQRPTTSIITGNIKANFPGRIACKVSASIDSKTILDRTGAQQLIGRGDMLYLNGGEPVRVQCAFVDTPEVERINDYIASQPGPVAPMELPEPAEAEGDGTGAGSGIDARTLDPYFEEASHAIVLTQQGSTSMIQRRFSIGYNRAGRLMDQLEQAGIVGPAQGSKPRDVLVQDDNQLQTLISSIRNR